MSSPQEQYTEAVRTSQEAMANAVETWTRTVQRAFGQTSAVGPAAVPDANEVIDQVFDFAEKMLEVQRDFAKHLASASISAGEAFQQQAGAAGEAFRQQAGALGETGRQQAGGR